MLPQAYPLYAVALMADDAGLPSRATVNLVVGWLFLEHGDWQPLCIETTETTEDAPVFAGEPRPLVYEFLTTDLAAAHSLARSVTDQR